MGIHGINRNIYSISVIFTQIFYSTPEPVCVCVCVCVCMYVCVFLLYLARHKMDGLGYNFFYSSL